MNMISSIILLLCLHAAHTQYCSGSYIFQYSPDGCIFDYDYLDANCTQFNFKQCNWIECVDWVQVGNDTVCGQTQIFWDYRWNYCTRQCCDYNFVYPYDYSSLGQCQEYLNQQQRIFIIIISSVFGGIVGIIVTVALCKGIASNRFSDCCQHLRSCFRTICGCLCFRRRKQQHLDEHNYPGEISYPDLRNSLIAQPNKTYETPQTPTPS